MSCNSTGDATTGGDRDVKSVTNDGHSVSFLSPAEQATEDRRRAERCGLKRSKPLQQFFRMFRITTQDRP
ncbi:MAG: hypothetical protein WBC44_13755 [Planctomycetaceae bacterium]